MKRFQRMYAWWYASLALGFFLLGWNQWLARKGGGLGGAALRWAVAAGFAGLAWMEWNKRRK